MIKKVLRLVNKILPAHACGRGAAASRRRPHDNLGAQWRHSRNGALACSYATFLLSLLPAPAKLAFSLSISSLNLSTAASASLRAFATSSTEGVARHPSS